MLVSQLLVFEHLIDTRLSAKNLMFEIFEGHRRDTEGPRKVNYLHQSKPIFF